MAALRWKLTDDGPPALFDADELLDRHVGLGEYRGMEFLHVNARTIVNHVPSGLRMPFEYTINAYRGCSHACTYCFARPTHAFLGLDIGDDFDRKIVVKVNAVERARAELHPRHWGGHHIALGTNTDPYQKAEGKYHLTRGLIEAMAESGTPFSILTKSTLILRDLDVLAEAAKRVSVRVNLSVGTLDADVCRASEPGTPPPMKRIEAVAKLNETGIACGVLMGPVLPGLSDRDDQLRAVVDAAVDAGAVSIGALMLHLRPGVREHYLDWLADAFPAALPDVVRRYTSADGSPRAYLPGKEQHELTDQVAAMAKVARSRRGLRRRG